MSRIFKIIALLGIMIFLGCEKDDDLEIDSIKIISVTPSSDLEDGVEYNFIVEIEYDLATASNGILLIGFNTSVVNSYTLIKDAAYNVKKGIGLLLCFEKI